MWFQPLYDLGSRFVTDVVGDVDVRLAAQHLLLSDAASGAVTPAPTPAAASAAAAAASVQEEVVDSWEDEVDEDADAAARAAPAPQVCPFSFFLSVRSNVWSLWSSGLFCVDPI